MLGILNVINQLRRYHNYHDFFHAVQQQCATDSRVFRNKERIAIQPKTCALPQLMFNSTHTHRPYPQHPS